MKTISTPPRSSPLPQGTPGHPGGGASSLFITGVLCLIVAAATLAAHGPVLSAQTILFDDGEYVTQNPLVQNPGWDSAGQFLREVRRPSTVQGYYQPLPMISLMLDYAMGGRPDNLRPFHRTSLILHAANAVFIVVLLYLLFGQPWVAAAGGLLFGMHPMTVEPVAWVGERKTVLAAFFALLCLISYVRYARRPGPLRYLLSLGLLVLALLAKPTVTALPLVLVLLDIWPLGRLSRWSLLEKVPFFLMAALSTVITVVSQRHLELSAFRELGADQTLLLICHDLVLYPFHLFWPVRLASFYPFPEPISLANPLLLLSVLLSAAILVLALISLRWTRALLTGWLCFLVLLAPTFLNKSYSPSAAWDKYAYLPMLGLLLMLAWLLGHAAAARPGQRLGLRQISSAVIVLLVAVTLGSATRRLLGHWQTTEGYCAYMLAVSGDSPLLYHHRGLCHYDRGDYPAAIEDYTRAIELKPDYAEAYSNLGNAFFGHHDYARAVGSYDRAIALLADDAKMYNNRAIAWFMLREYDKAWADVRTCRRLGGRPAPDFVATLVEASGKTDEGPHETGPRP